MSERERAGRDWRAWGPYLSERQWGTVREDYSADGEAWNYLSYEQARSRAYRWGEDGLAGFSDAEQRFCLALALWNGRDEFCKERIFGLTGPEGNHGEDAKDYWWFLDAVPSHAWNRWRYHYPQAAFPYAALRETGRTRADPELELLDTGVFDDDRYWIVEVDYAKAGRHDVLMTVRVTNAGPDRERLHVLPTAWFRNTWTWEPESPRPELAATGDAAVRVEHPGYGELELLASGRPELLFCENETNTERLYGVPNATPYPKDGINDHVVSAAASVNPARRGTKCAAWYRLDVDPKSTVEIRLRLHPTGSPLDDALGADFERVVADREREADEFYAELTPPAASADEAAVMRQAFAGMLWSKQFYNYSVARWLDGDPGQPVPPPERLGKRNSRWRQFDAYDVMSMPDTWEYPWFASWDLAFHCVALAHVDAEFAKDQLLLVCREWFQHPNGALPAYEWDFGDVNPPVQAWAALEVFAIDGGTDLDFLSKVFDKLLVNFTWWVNREDADGSNLFEGGFLGLDNVGPIDRSHLPDGWVLEQSDATGWMAMYALAMTTIAAILDRAAQRPAADLVDKFLEHFAGIRAALERQGMWDDADGLFYDRLVAPGRDPVPVKVHSMVGMVPALAVAFVDERILDPAVAMGKQFAGFLDRHGLRDAEKLVEAGYLRGATGSRRLLLSAVGLDRVRRLFGRLFDEGEFLSPHGLRSLSAYHREHPYTFDAGELHATVDYQPAESRIEMFGGNSNWRGPVWFPLNYLVTSALERYHRFFGADLTVEYPTGSGEWRTLHEVTTDLWARLVSIFTVGPDGRRPCFGGVERLQRDPEWKDNLMFHEYFHGDDAAGLGASHQTGWTGIVADVIRRRHGMVPSVAEIVLGTEDDR
jgi:hypothetical protein